MSNNLSGRVEELIRATRMLAIVGASLKSRSAESVDSAMDEQINKGLRLILGDTGTDAGDPDIAPLLTQIDMAFAESGELWRNPHRTAGWQVEDQQLLQAMGRASRGAQCDPGDAGADIKKPAAQGLAQRGTCCGQGEYAVESAAETCPDLEVDAIDIWEPALRIAAENLAASPHAHRVQLRHLDITRLEPGPRYTSAWLPTMFLNRAVVGQAVERIAAASRPGGWLVAAMYTQPEDPFMAVVSSLRTLRSGGEVTDPAELEALLRARGYVDVESDVAPVATFVLGRLP